MEGTPPRAVARRRAADDDESLADGFRLMEWREGGDA